MKSTKDQKNDKITNNTVPYQQIFASTPDLAYVVDEHCALLDCNQNLMKLLNVTSIEDKIGTVSVIYKLMLTSGVWTEQQAQKIKSKDIDAILNNKESIEQPEIPIIEKNDTIHHYVSSRIPILNDDKEVLALLVILREATKVVEMEEQLTNIRQQLRILNSKTEQAIIPEPKNDRIQKTVTILIIEDSKIAQQATQSILMQIDCIAEIATTEHDFNQNFKPGKYNLIFMDIGLGETSGYIMAKRIRELEEGTNYHVPIIALTSYNAENITYDCSCYSMEGAITKPLSVEQAREIIQLFVHKIDINVQGFKKASST